MSNTFAAKIMDKRNHSRFWNSKLPEYAVIVLYFVLYCVISAFHEPWFDEAQSWQIAKCESIGRLLFYIPHYEGNPPLWYLILAIPAKLGLPFELGLKSVGIVISLCSISLLELKAPFPRAVKLALPFTYFFFYQYGIIVRPYGLMILAFILAAMTFKKRNEQPWKLVLCLAFLCETSSFCVVIAGGIAACWLFEIMREGFHPQKWLRDKRLYALLVLLIFALILVVTILPSADASFLNGWEIENSALKCFLVGMTSFLSETLLITSSWFSNDQTALNGAYISLGSWISCAIVQTIILLCIWIFSSKKSLKYFFVPYTLFCLFGAIVFLGGHHLGIGYCVFIFWLWITCDDDMRFENGKLLACKFHITDKDKALLRQAGIAFCALSLVVTLGWSLISSVADVKYLYSYGRDTSRFLEETGLINTKIAMGWGSGKDESGGVDYGLMDTKYNGWPVSLCAYAGKNIVYNFNDGADESAYVAFIRPNAEENRKSIERWRSAGIPDVLLGEVDVAFLTNDAVSIKDYTPVYPMEINYIWKGKLFSGFQYLFVRNDLLDDYALDPIVRPEGMTGTMGFEITDEIRERYENGEDIDDILKPYLDYLFGEESAK